MVMELLSGKIRAEMKQRVEEVLKAGETWSMTAKELTEALNRLTNAVLTGNPDPADAKLVARCSRKLAKETGRLRRAFDAHGEILEKVLMKFT